MPETSRLRRDEFADLYRFNAWASDRILGGAEALTPEEFHRDLGSSFPSVRDTLVHVLESETGWVYRWQGLIAPDLPDGWDLESVPGLRSAWSETRARQDAFFDSLVDSDLDEEIEYRSRAGYTFTPALWQMLRHVVNHSTYHRGQVVTMLRQLGHGGVKTDLIHYYRETGSDT